MNPYTCQAKSLIHKPSSIPPGSFWYWNIYCSIIFILDETNVSQSIFAQGFVSVLQKVLSCDYLILAQILIWLKFLSLRRFLSLWLKHWLSLRRIYHIFHISWIVVSFKMPFFSFLWVRGFWFTTYLWANEVTGMVFLEMCMFPLCKLFKINVVTKICKTWSLVMSSTLKSYPSFLI